MLRVTLLRHHQPLIRFIHAIRKGGGLGANGKGSSSVGGGATSKAVLDSFDALPKKFQPRLFTEEEMELIMMGGAAPYVPKSLQRKKK
ncbi:hypothetical protein DQ04_01701100 [Trypanosoma grayi]|uniref:hypothetical protein n=1 Tax=Trypanosoma grayi TaxID=71804 RepID=UPI0004F4579F|nr:hypothetical protein DQ04_01701100 [Trypanosoma grayi]KEG12459.1 hypothetical protein DQ04_01701100 [Trypanosoma grayi]